MQLDPTICIFRGDEEDPIAVIHLNPDAACYESNHIMSRHIIVEEVDGQPR